MGLSLKSIGGFLGKAVGKVVPYGDLALGALSLIGGAKSRGKADKLAGQASGLQRQRYNETAPLRAGALSRLTNTQRPDLSSIYAGSENPFARPLRPLSPMMGATTPRGPEAINPMERPLRRIYESPYNDQV